MNPVWGAFISDHGSGQGGDGEYSRNASGEAFMERYDSRKDLAHAGYCCPGDRS